MSVARFLAGTFGPSIDVSSPSGWSGFFGAPMRTDTGVFVSERLALNLTGVQACVGLIADTLSMIPAVVEQENRSGSTWTAITDDPRSWLLNVQPNDYMTPLVARRTTQTVALLWGNACSEIVRNGRGQGVQMWPMPAGGVRPVREIVAGQPRVVYRGAIDGKPWEGDPSDVVHLRGLTLCGMVGLSPIAEARQAVGLGIALEKFGNKLFANDLRSGGYLQHPKTLSAEARKNLEESFNAQGGLQNAHSVKLLEEGMTFSAGTIPPEDAQFLGTREFTIAEFARMFRVPLELLAAQGKTSSWGSGIEQLFLAFVQWTLRPWITQWEQELTLKLLTTQELASGVRIRFQVKEILRGDSAARSAFYDRMVRLGALTINEVRAEEGRNPLAGGDVPMDPRDAPSQIPSDLQRQQDQQRKQENPQ